MTKARNLSKLMSDNIVGTTELADNAVTTAKLANDAVTAAKLDIDGGDISYDNSVSGISATTLQAAIDYLNVLSGGGSAGAQATYTREEFTATAGQTTFTTVNGYTLGYLQVFMNGIMLDSGDYTANDESTVVLATGAAANDEVTTIAYDSFAISEVLRVLSVSASAPDNSLSLNTAGQLVFQNGGAGASSGSRYGIGKGSVGNIHIIGTYGSTPTSTSQHGITYQNNFADTTQAAVIITDNSGDGTSVGLFSTESYAIGPQLGLSVEPNGSVTKPLQPAFDVSYSGSGYSYAGTVVFNTIHGNVGGYYSTSTGRFTAPVSGSYLFYTTYIKNNDTTTGRRRFDKNGSAYGGGGSGRHLRLDDGQTYGDNGVLQAIIYLSAGDFVSVNQFAGSSYGTNEYDYFGGYLIG